MTTAQGRIVLYSTVLGDYRGGVFELYVHGLTSWLDLTLLRPGSWGGSGEELVPANSSEFKNLASGGGGGVGGWSMVICHVGDESWSVWGYRLVKQGIWAGHTGDMG